MDYVILLICIVGIAILWKSCCKLYKTGGRPHFFQVHDETPVLLVDMANMLTPWHMEKYGKTPRAFSQPSMMELYIECMQDHFAEFRKHNACGIVEYVIKNHRCNGKTSGPISPKTINMFKKLSKSFSITFVEDHRKINVAKWKSPRYHYMRGRDDFMCFALAQQYKKQYKKAIIMSNDAYKDFEQFGYIEPFKRTSFYDGKVITSTITPRHNGLGQIRDYTLVRISPTYKINKCP